MSIRDFDPLLKKTTSTSTKKGATQVTTSTSTIQVQGAGNFITRINIGRNNIRVDGDSSDALAVNMQAGFRELAADLKAFTDTLEGYLPEDLAAALAPTLELSMVYCPKDTGALVESAYLATEKYRGGVRVEIGYARNNTPDYAVYVHEMPYQHEAPTSDKFLQRAIDEDFFNIPQRVVANLRARMGL